MGQEERGPGRELESSGWASGSRQMEQNLVGPMG